MKILHYAVIQMDIHDKKIKRDEVSFGPTISLDTNPIDQIQINSQDTDLYR